MDLLSRYVRFIRDHNRLTLLIILVATAGIGVGLTMTDGGFVIASFESDAPEADASEYINENFATDSDTVTTLVVLRESDERDNALSRDGILASLELQEAIRDDPAISPTLAEDTPTIGFANLVAFEALAEEDEPPTAPTLTDQYDAIADRSDAKIEALIEQVVDTDDRTVQETIPASFDQDTSSASSQLFVVTHDRGDPDTDELPTDIVDAQLAIDDRSAAFDTPYDVFAFGPGIVDERSAQATGESFALLGPLALVLVLAILTVTYRDPIDVLLGVTGIGLVLVWMGGFVGWLGIEFTQILIAVPFLLVGLSIDYAFHVVMRYREEHRNTSVSDAFLIALTGVLVAIGATTITTAIGFFSNVTSPIGAIRDFGILSGLGILAAFLVFGAFIPALKFEIESWFEGRGRKRTKRAFGTGKRTARFLGIGVRAASRAPAVVIGLLVVVSLFGAYGAVNVDTSIDQDDFLPEDRQAWMEHVPEPIQPGEYRLAEQSQFLASEYSASSVDSSIDVLVTGDVTNPDAIAAIADAGDVAASQSSTFDYSNDEAAVQTPLDVISEIAASDEAVEAALYDSDTTGNEIPDSDIEALFDAAYASDPEAMSSVAARSDSGEYQALRIDITTDGDASGSVVLAEMRAVSTVADEPDSVDAIATGPLIILELVQDDVLETLVTTFALTLTLVGIFLAVLFGRLHRSYSLGIVTILPVLAALSWILGTMYLLEIPYNSETAIITGIAIGIGVDFAIHISERYVQERDRLDTQHDALQATVKGTGGAILASALTTVVGFGILALTLVPSLQRFGIVTGLTIAFAWVASVFMLPSLLVLWDRYLAPA